MKGQTRLKPLRFATEVGSVREWSKRSRVGFEKLLPIPQHTGCTAGCRRERLQGQRHAQDLQQGRWLSRNKARRSLIHGLPDVQRLSTDKEVSVPYTGIRKFVPGFVRTHRIGVRVAFAIPTWTNSTVFTYTDSPKGKGRKRSTQAALLSTRTRENWHPSGETRKSLTGSGKCLAA